MDLDRILITLAIYLAIAIPYLIIRAITRPFILHSAYKKNIPEAVLLAKHVGWVTSTNLHIKTLVSREICEKILDKAVKKGVFHNGPPGGFYYLATPEHAQQKANID